MAIIDSDVYDVIGELFRQTAGDGSAQRLHRGRSLGKAREAHVVGQQAFEIFR
ncbi:MAG: hypothetical protein AAGJ86_04250 [Pseudomonadota bacterium]